MYPPFGKLNIVFQNAVYILDILHGLNSIKPIQNQCTSLPTIQIDFETRQTSYSNNKYLYQQYGIQASTLLLPSL